MHVEKKVQGKIRNLLVIKQKPRHTLNVPHDSHQDYREGHEHFPHSAPTMFYYPLAHAGKS